MDPKTNPFSPGAGTAPPELAGRSVIIRDADIALGRARNHLSPKGLFLLGLRGVGKTVLLNRIAEQAEIDAYLPMTIEVSEHQRLAEQLVPALRSTLFRLNAIEKARVAAKEGLEVLLAFAGMIKVKAGELEVGLAPRRGVADSGNLESDLPELFVAVAKAAKAAETVAALFIDEMQFLTEEDLSALIVSLHRVTQKTLPLVLFGAGLPQLAGLAGEAKSYAERLFAYPEIGPLTPEAAKDAIVEPLRRNDVSIEPDALELLLAKTKGYPYFLQEWGSQAWNAAAGSPITAADCRLATKAAIDSLDRNFFRVRFDRLTPMEKDYIRAMAKLGVGPHRSGDIASELHQSVREVASRRTGLIKKGMIYSEQYGDTAFTVPMFNEFMMRTMPDWKPPVRRKARKK
jgi:hypothetical protein